MPKLTKAEYDILNSEELKQGFSKSSPFLRSNEKIITALVKRGLIIRDNDGWSEDWYTLSSNGRLESNLFGREK